MKTNAVTACVVDHGIFLPIAQRLARDFKKVYYWSPWEKAFPTVKDLVGVGFDEVEHVNSIWDINQCDLFVFPDIGFAPLQKHLLSQGYPVWGARDGDKIEMYRGKFLNLLRQTELPVPVCERIPGLTALRKHLEDKTDKWVKISKFRGDFETFHWRDFEQDESTLDAYSVKFGPWKDQVNFYVFDPVETNIEDGYDGYCIDGQWPNNCIHGMEAKDKAYLGAIQKYEDLPEEIRIVNDQFSPILAGYGYRSFFSTEVRITDDDESYFLDPTCRAGSPPSQVQTEMIGNYGDIIWQGANGVCVDIEPVKEFGVQALLTVKGGRANWNSVCIPDAIKQWVKCGFCSQIGERLVFPPDPENTTGDIGWLVAIGDTPKEAIEQLKKHAEQLPDGVCANVESIASLISEVEEAKDKGMEMTDKPMPEPSIVL